MEGIPHSDFELIRSTLRQPVFFDGRNIYEPALMRAFGIEYAGIGRGAGVRPVPVPIVPRND